MDIVVTGASRGLGRELCRVLLERGDRVWGIARGDIAPFDDEADRFFRSRCDVADASAVRRWMEEMEALGFSPDTIIVSAGIQRDDLGETFDADAAAQTVDINLTGALRCVGAFLPRFLRSGRGQFVVVTSTAVYRPSRRSAGYAASKAGLSMALRTLRLKYGRYGIRFREVRLGPMRTAMWEGGTSFLVPSPQAVADRIILLLHGGRDTIHVPFLATLLLRLSRWLPDRMFQSLSNRLL